MLRRLYSTAAASTGKSTHDIAAEFLSRTVKRGPLVQKQFLDANQLQKFSLTLNRPDLYHAHSIIEHPPAKGTSLPPGYHLAYFTPSFLETDLGQDGTDKSFNPSAPFTRRMWAGGEMIWTQGNPLKVGDTVYETTTVKSAEAKRTRDGVEMIVVGVEKIFENDEGIALKDKRNWLFRPEFGENTPSFVEQGEVKPFPEGSHTRDFCQNPVTLFRFSALTFNAHKIHYSRPWCREVEGHRELVVHGPLNLINILDFWRDLYEKGDLEFPKSVKYRAMSPVYAEEPYRAVMEKKDDGAAEVKLWTADGKLAMSGDITSF